MRIDEVIAATICQPPRSTNEMWFSKSEGPAQQGISREQFVALTIRYERRIRVFVSSLHPQSSDIDEILQDAWLVAWKKLDSFRYIAEKPDEEFVRWLCTIARYQVSTYRRKNASRLLLDDAVIEQLASLQLNESAYFEARHDALLNCIDNLRSRDKELVRRRYQEGIPAQDLAEWLGRSIDTVYKSLHRIRSSLLVCVDRTLQREGLADG